MILYNVTVKISHDSHADWLKWMQEIHIPEVMDTGLFENSRILKLLGYDDDEGLSYAIQYQCKDMATLEEYQEKHAKALQEKHTTRYKDKYVAFRTLMEVVNSY